MAKATFSFSVNGDDPTDHDRPTGKVTDVNPAKFMNALASGKLKVIGFIFGELEGANLDVEECEESQQNVEILDGSPCVVLYVGGTAYKICP